VKTNITKKHNIVINFSNSHNFYISAYRYVCKKDTNVYHSTNHPDLSAATSPKTKNSIAGNRAAGVKRKSMTSTTTSSA